MSFFQSNCPAITFNIRSDIGLSHVFPSTMYKYIFFILCRTLVQLPITVIITNNGVIVILYTQFLDNEKRVVDVTRISNIACE